jgi:hypothetical protein
MSYFVHNKTARKWNWQFTFNSCWCCECMQLQAPYMPWFLSSETASLSPLAFQTICSEISSLTMCELLYMCAYSYTRCLNSYRSQWVSVLTVVDGSRGSGWLTGSRPRRILLALWLSFSQAWARICSACTEVRCAGVGRVCANTHHKHKNMGYRGKHRSTVTYLLKARTMEPGKQPLLCNDCERGGYTRTVSGQRLSK